MTEMYFDAVILAKDRTYWFNSLYAVMPFKGRTRSSELLSQNNDEKNNYILIFDKGTTQLL